MFTYHSFWPIILFVFLAQTSSFAQIGNVIADDRTYVDYIKTVECKVSNVGFSYPFIRLNGGSLMLSFDDLRGEENDYYYWIYHMDRDWNYSDIDEEDYLDGFNGEEIRNYRYSGQTTEPYIHYDLTIPNQEQRLLLSGNYLLVVVDENEKPVLSRRFVIFENKTEFDVSIERSFTPNEVRTHQRVDLRSIILNGSLEDPQENIELRIMQNGNWDQAYHNIIPSYVREENVLFDKGMNLSFEGLNEFRNFDTRSLEYVTNNIHSIDINLDRIDVLLKKATPRPYNTHSFENDNNGQFYINQHRQNAFDQQYRRALINAEYTNVIFNLFKEFPYDEDVYILGAFNNYEKDPEFKMTFDAERGIYLCETLLKQGYYDYYFGLDMGDYFDYVPLEGSHAETENDYTIIVYYRSTTDYQDRVIGLITFSSSD